MSSTSTKPVTISFSVKVQPCAAKASIVGLEGDFLKVRLAARPVQGKANETLVEILARNLKVQKSSIKIRSGFSSRRKIVQIENCTEQKLRAFLNSL